MVVSQGHTRCSWNTAPITDRDDSGTPGYGFFYDPGVEQEIRWERDGQSYPYEKFAAKYHRPDLVR